MKVFVFVPELGQDPHAQQRPQPAGTFWRTDRPDMDGANAERNQRYARRWKAASIPPMSQAR